MLYNITQKYKKKLEREQKKKLDSVITKPKEEIQEKHLLSSQNNKGKLKKYYRDMPRYKAIFQYEKEFNERYEKNLKKMVLHISGKLVEFISKK